MRVLFVTSEIYPLIKTGGLADVCGALPAALAALDVEARVLVPGYPAVLQRLPHAGLVAVLPNLFGGEGRLLSGVMPDGTMILALEAPHLYGRPGNPYLGPDGQDWPDNHRRFAALSWVGAMIGQGLIESWQPDVVHAHDWQGGLAPAYLALAGGPRPATITTIHNIAFQGLTEARYLDELRLPGAAFNVEGLETWGRIGFLKAGLYYSDRLTTVSPTYAREIQGAEQGMGLEGLLRSRARDLVGIVNGIDDAVWNPADDTYLPAPYSATDLAPKAQSKAALQARFGLEADDKALLFCVVSRLTEQKGLDLLIQALPGLIAQGGQLAVLGTGQPWLEEAFRRASAEHVGKIGCIIGYDEPLSHLMQAGSDAIIVPSRFEPCGLTQLYGLRYGTLPVVARVGGLADTVIDANEAALADRVATGFQFAPLTAEALGMALDRAFALWADPEAWQRTQIRAMTRKLGWTAAAGSYVSLYRNVVASRGG